MVMIELLPRTAISTPAFEDSFQSTLILTFRKYLHCPIGNRITGLFCYWSCFKTVIKASEHWAQRLKVELFSLPMRQIQTGTVMPTSIPPSGNGAPCCIRLFLTKIFAESPSWINLSFGSQIPGFHLFWWRLMSLGLLAMSGLQVWSHAHSVGEKRLSKIPIFILLYQRHEAWRRWVSDMWYQPRWK